MITTFQLSEVIEALLSGKRVRREDEQDYEYRKYNSQNGQVDYYEDDEVCASLSIERFKEMYMKPLPASYKWIIF